MERDGNEAEEEVFATEDKFYDAQGLRHRKNGGDTNSMKCPKTRR